MHQAIFSDKERGMIKEYLDTGVQGEGFRVLKHRVNGYELKLVEDFDLMIKFRLSLDKHKKRLE